MNILFVSGHYPPFTKGGGELSTHFIAQGLVQREHTVHVIADGDTYDGVLDGVKVTRRPLGLTAKPLLEKYSSRKIARNIRKLVPDLERYDIVHTHDFRSALAVSELNLKNAVVTARDYAQISGCTNNITIDGNTDPGCQGWREATMCHRVAEASIARKPFRMWQFMYNKGYRAEAFRTFSKHVFISNAQRDEILRYQNLTDVETRVIYNPVSPGYLSKPLESGTQGNVLYVGRVEMYKGVKLLLDAWRKYSKQNPDAHLTIVGQGAQREEYEKLVSQWGLQYRVTFEGHIPYERMINIYDHAQVVVAPHVWIEPFGRTVVEGMARGKVVVTTHTGGPGEIIEHEKTGLLFEQNNVDSLIQMIDQGLTMNHYDKKEICLAAQAWVREHLIPEKIAEQHEALYLK